MEAAEEAHRQHEENPELQVRTEKKGGERNGNEKKRGKEEKERQDSASLGTSSRGWAGAAARSAKGTVGP